MQPVRKSGGYGGQQTGDDQKPVADMPYIYAQILRIPLSQQ